MMLDAISSSQVGLSAEEKDEAPNDTTFKRWNCHSSRELLCKLCRTFPPPAMGVQFTICLGQTGYADPLVGWRCSS